MKEMLKALLKRNGIIAGGFLILTTILSFLPQYSGAAVFVVFGGIIGLIWANGILTKHMPRLMAALLTAVITLMVGGFLVLAATAINKLVTGWK